MIASATTSSRNHAERLLARVQWHVVRRLDGILQGDYRSLFTGHGLDLAEVREYQIQDDVRYMDWNVTARLDTPHVRQYIEDRQITAWLVLDLSGSVDYGTAAMSKRDLLAEFAATISFLLTRHGNRVGALLFTEGVDRVVTARSGRRHTLSLLHELGRPAGAAVAGGTDLPRALAETAGILRQRSLVFVVSDFIGRPGWDVPLARLAQRHEVVAVRLTDPREEELPDVGPLVLEDAETGEQLYVDTRDRKFRERFAALAAERREALTRTFARQGIDVLHLSTDGDVVRDLARFALRRRQAHARFGGQRLPAGQAGARSRPTTT